MKNNLKGAAEKLAKLVEEAADYEFEGFTWLAFNREIVAKKIGVSEKTISRLMQKPPFHHITRLIEVEGKPRRVVFLKLGGELCETDHVFRLRSAWVRGMIYFNAALVDQLTVDVMYLKSIGAPKTQYERLLRRIEQARKGAKGLEKLKAGKKVALQVPPHQMGLLRGIVQVLGDDAHGCVASLVTLDGWHSFSAHLKAEGRLARFYHWPHLGTIISNPDIAVQTYLDVLQAAGKIDPAESIRLLAKIEALSDATVMV